MISFPHKATIIQFMIFGSLGVFGFFVDYAFFHLALDIFGFGHYFSSLFSFPFAATFTWAGNRVFTFRGQGSHAAHIQWARFLVVNTGGIILNRGTFSLMVFAIPFAYQYPVIALLGGTAAGMFFNFFASRRLVFR